MPSFGFVLMLNSGLVREGFWHPSLWVREGVFGIPPLACASLLQTIRTFLHLIFNQHLEVGASEWHWQQSDKPYIILFACLHHIYGHV